MLIASLVISIFAASFTFMAASGIKLAARSKQLTSSAFASKSMMEKLRSVPFDSLFSYNNAKFDNGAGTISISPAGNDLISIAVSDKVEFNTLRSRY